MATFPLTVDEVVQFHAEITSVVALRAVATVGLQRPVVWGIADAAQPDANVEWKLRARAGGEVDDGLSFIVPNDYNASTNNVIWVRIS